MLRSSAGISCILICSPVQDCRHAASRTRIAACSGGALPKSHRHTGTAASIKLAGHFRRRGGPPWPLVPLCPCRLLKLKPSALWRAALVLGPVANPLSTGPWMIRSQRPASSTCRRLAHFNSAAWRLLVVSVHRKWCPNGVVPNHHICPWTRTIDRPVAVGMAVQILSPLSHQRTFIRPPHSLVTPYAGLR